MNIRSHIRTLGIVASALRLGVLALALQPAAPTWAELAPSGTASILAADRTLARDVSKNGLRDGLLAHMVGYSTLFMPLPVEGGWLREHPMPFSPLRWEQEELELAASGELGYVLSRWELPATSSVPASRGHQVTIWKWWPQAEWRLLLRIATEDTTHADSTTIRSLRPELRSVLSHGAEAEERQALLEADQDLVRRAAKDGWAAAFASRAAPDVRVLRSGAPPARGKDAALVLIGAEGGAWTCDPVASRVSQSGDLGYTYGTWAQRTGSSGADSVLTRSYVRVWRKRTQDDRQIALDVALPIASPKH
jgi:ketosteroid isomerase-like protein